MDAKSPFTKFAIDNQSGDPFTVWIEPWAEDYTLLHGQEVEIRVWKGTSEEPPYFHAVHHKSGDVQVYLEGSIDEWGVFQDGTEVECGHNRQTDGTGER